MINRFIEQNMQPLSAVYKFEEPTDITMLGSDETRLGIPFNKIAKVELLPNNICIHNKVYSTCTLYGVNDNMVETAWLVEGAVAIQLSDVVMGRRSVRILKEDQARRMSCRVKWMATGTELICAYEKFEDFYITQTEKTVHVISDDYTDTVNCIDKVKIKTVKTIGDKGYDNYFTKIELINTKNNVCSHVYNYVSEEKLYIYFQSENELLESNKEYSIIVSSKSIS